MRDVYIPDLTERFPEGFGGVDLTDSYFPDWRHGTERAYSAAMEERLAQMEAQDSEDDE